MSAAVLMLAVAVAYIERTTISHALPFIIDEAHLTKSESGLILSGFGFGYVLSLPFSGWIIQKLGHAATLRWLSIGWLVSAIGFSFADNYASMFLARLVLGVFEGPLFPLFVSWLSLSTKSESRPVAIGFIESCSYVGMAFAGPITVGIAQSSNWRMAYACVGAMALVVSLASFRLQEPRKFEGQPDDPLAPPKAKRNRQVLVSSALIAMGFLLYNTAKSFYSTWFPTILVKGFGQTSADAAMVTLIQSLAAPLASLAVAAASVSLLRTGVSVSIARCVPLGLGLSLGATIYAALQFPQSVSIFSTIAFVGLISTSALIWNAIPDTVEPIHVGLAAGWVNALANVGTIISPIVVGRLFQKSLEVTLSVVALICLLAIPFFILSYSAGRSVPDR